MAQLQHFVNGHWLACIVCTNIGMYFIWIASAQRGRVYRLICWLVRIRAGNAKWLTEELLAQLSRGLCAAFAVLAIGIGVYHGAFGLGLLKDAPPPPQWQIDAAKKRFEEVRKNRRLERDAERNVNRPAPNQDGPSESN
jgi:hypothetical protein